MKITRKNGVVEVWCPAKVNLFLEVHGRRPDGYHEIETVMQAVTLYDRLELQRRQRDGIAFRCSDPRLPRGIENLAYRAADLLARKVGFPGGVSVTLEKRIPFGAGLGGGSSDAAGVLAGLDELFDLHLGKGRLCGLAAEIGSDVAFFVHGGTARCTGRGEHVTPVPVRCPMHYVICCPPVVLHTAEVYQNLARMGLTRGNESARVILDALAKGDLVSVCGALFNRLDEVAVSLEPEVGEVKRALAEAASTSALVSGSGAAAYALLASAEQAADAAALLKERDVGRVFVAQAERRDPV